MIILLAINMPMTFERLFSRGSRHFFYRINKKALQSCSCGAPIENAEHYFFECLLKTNQRNTLFL